MIKGVGYVDRWIRFGGRKGFVTFNKFREERFLLFVGPFRFQYLGKRARCSLLPWRSKFTGSILWLRLCVGFERKGFPS